MKNNSTLRIKTLQKLGFELMLNKASISTQTENHFIGLGSGGMAAMMHIHSRKVPGHYTAVGESDKIILPQEIKLIPITAPKRVLLTGAKYGNVLVPDMEQTLEMPNALKQLLEENRRFVLLAALGGFIGTKLIEALVQQLQKEQKDYVAICSIPFSFEGRRRLANSRKALEQMKTIPNCYFFELNILRNENENLLLNEAFPAADRCFYRIIRELGLV